MPIRLLFPIAAALLVTATASPADASCKRVLYALASGAQEDSPTPQGVVAAGVFVVDTDRNELTYRVAVFGLSSPETSTHLHGFAPPGQSAFVKLFLDGSSPVKQGVMQFTEAEEPMILAGYMYLNVHTVRYPLGEAKGQVMSSLAELDGQQVSPPVQTPARGYALLNINAAANRVEYYIRHIGLSAEETETTFRGPAGFGQNGPILATLPAGNPKIGVWLYGDEDEEALLRGRAYVNVASAAFPGGELRGQIAASVAVLDGKQESPPVNTTAGGFGIFSLDTAGDALGFDIRSVGLVETAAHIHGLAPKGVTAPPLFTLPPTARKLGTWAYDPAHESGLLGGLTYVNVHSTAFAGGEIRGQIEFPGLPCAGDVDGDGQVGQTDLGALLAAYGSQSGAAGYSPCADLDGDGEVDQADLGILLAHFGSTCP